MSPIHADHDHAHEDGYDHHLGLAHDLSRLIDRRRALRLMAGAALVTMGACAGDDADPTSAGTTSPTDTGGAGTQPSSTAAGAGASCETIPAETAGPFPGDGSNGPNVLDDTGIVRSDIRSSFGSSSTVAPGVPLTVNLVILDRSGGCVPMAGAAVYLWHCDRDGRYSLYSEGVTGENYLRGVQAAGDDGRVSFLTIYPGAYPGRWPHIHFEVYRALDQASSVANRIATSQLAFPEDACRQVYATTGYGDSLTNLDRTPLARDGIFRDGSDQQMATITGSVADGLLATLTVPV